MEQFFPFAFHQLSNRDAGPLANDFSNLFFIDFIAKQIGLAGFFGNFFFFLQLFFQLRQLTVFQLSGFVQIVLTLCFLDLAVHIFDLFTEFLNLTDGILFILPLSFHGVELLAHFSQFASYLF